jgi:hypothetical protein
MFALVRSDYLFLFIFGEEKSTKYRIHQQYIIGQKRFILPFFGGGGVGFHFICFNFRRSYAED